MEKLRNMNVRQIVAAGLVLLGASAIMGCSESRDSSYQLLVECPDNTELEVLEVSNGKTDSDARVTCVDEDGIKQVPYGMELIGSTDPNAVTVDSGKSGQHLNIETTTSWTKGLTTSRTNMTTDLNFNTATINFDGAYTVINAIQVKA